MALYRTNQERCYIPEGTVVWAYAFEKNNDKEGMSLMQKPVRGVIKPGCFVPFRKNSDVLLAESRAISLHSRYYADTEEEAGAAYNRLVDRWITWHRNEIERLEGMRI